MIYRLAICFYHWKKIARMLMNNHGIMKDTFIPQVSTIASNELPKAEPTCPIQSHVWKNWEKHVALHLNPKR